MYRPQFAYHHPRQFDDIDFVHTFDFTNTPLLNNTALAVGGTILNIPLQLQTDWPFFVRGMQVKGGPTFAGPPPVQVRFKDPFSHDLGNDWAWVFLYVTPTGAVSSETVLLAPFSGASRSNPLTVVLEPEVRSPAGSVWWLSVRNPSVVDGGVGSAVDLTQFRLIMQGVKRRLNGGGGCAS